MKRIPICSVDISIKNLGYAFLKPEGEIVTVGILQQDTPQSVDYHTRGWHMARQLLRVIEEAAESIEGPLDVILEVPSNWFDSRGMDSKNSEAVQKLYYQAGAIVGALATSKGVHSIWTVTPIQWKGTTPKDVMVRRAKAFAGAQGIFLRNGIPHDSCEALLLGKYAVQLRQEDGYDVPLVCVHQRGAVSQGQFTIETFVDEGDPLEGGAPEAPGIPPAEERL